MHGCGYGGYRYVQINVIIIGTVLKVASQILTLCSNYWTIN